MSDSESTRTSDAAPSSPVSAPLSAGDGGPADAPEGGANGAGRVRRRASLLDSAPVRLLGGFGLAFVVLLLLCVVTWVGTLYQVDHGIHDAQRRYFDSLIVVHHFGPFGIPLPGAALLLGILFVNLIVGGILRIRKNPKTVGIIIAHVGILIMIVASAVKFWASNEGYLRLWEGETGGYYESHHEWELVVLEPLQESGGTPTGKTREHVIPYGELRGLRPSDRRRFESAALPFAVEVFGFARDSEPRVAKPANGHGSTPMAGVAVDGVELVAVAPNKEAELRVPGCYVLVSHDRGAGARPAPTPAILWGLQRQPYVFETGGKRFGLDLRRKRYPMPFDVRLDDFRHSFHPGTRMARSFESDVTVLPKGTTSASASASASGREVFIKMNEPLRDRGLILFQTNWGPQDVPNPTQMYSVFAVVDNPSDQWPAWSCLVIGLGLSIHFLMKLVAWIQAELQRAGRRSKEATT